LPDSRNRSGPFVAIVVVVLPTSTRDNDLQNPSTAPPRPPGPLPRAGLAGRTRLRVGAQLHPLQGGAARGERTAQQVVLADARPLWSGGPSPR
jgi:hypothetical protein